MSRQRSSPSADRRRELTRALRERGQSPYNLWLVRPPFENEDLILSSDPLVELFYAIEGDATFLDIDYQPIRSAKPIDKCVEQHFANVTRANSVVPVLWTGDAKHLGHSSSTEARYSLSDLDALAQRTKNWRQIILCIRRVRLHETGVLERRVESFVRDTADVTLRLILHRLGDHPQGLVIGAIAICLRKRLITGDLDHAPWSKNTRLWTTP